MTSRHIAVTLAVTATCLGANSVKSFLVTLISWWMRDELALGAGVGLATGGGRGEGQCQWEVWCRSRYFWLVWGLRLRMSVAHSSVERVFY